MAALVGVILASACGSLAQPSKPGPPAPGGNPGTSPISTQGRSPGYLEGRASIGPLQPVERIGVPSPTPPPAACTSRGLVIFADDTGAEVQRLAFGPDCGYRVALPPDTYRVELDRRGIDTSRDVPRTVSIQAGQTTRLDVRIDTGIR